MTDPTQIARGIAEQIILESRQDQFCLAVAWRDHLQTWIAAGLREADAEGYRRGVEECIAQCFLNNETARGTGGGE